MVDPLALVGSGETVFKDRQLVVKRTADPDGLRFVGEIDISNSAVISEALFPVLSTNERPHLDLSGLIFCDVSGIRALVNVAQRIGPERRLLIHGLAPELERVIRVAGWADESGGLSFCGCGEGQE